MFSNIVSKALFVLIFLNPWSRHLCICWSLKLMQFYDEIKSKYFYSIDMLNKMLSFIWRNHNSWLFCDNSKKNVKSIEFSRTWLSFLLKIKQLFKTLILLIKHLINEFLKEKSFSLKVFDRKLRQTFECITN
jgi:hypothetical protein